MRSEMKSGVIAWTVLLAPVVPAAVAHQVQSVREIVRGAVAGTAPRTTDGRRGGRRAAEAQLFGETDSQLALVFGCGPVFGPETTPESLATTFGEANVVSADVHVGEGEYEPGAIIFGDTEDRISVTWKDAPNRRSPSAVRIRSAGSSWETPHGLRIGLDLQSVEEINGRPFELTGFGWDYSGTVVSWEDGHLEAPPGAPCRIIARLSPARTGDDPDLRQAYRQMVGSFSHSSEHPAMQLLNPTIYELLLWFH